MTAFLCVYHARAEGGLESSGREHLAFEMLCETEPCSHFMGIGHFTPQASKSCACPTQDQKKKELSQ